MLQLGRQLNLAAEPLDIDPGGELGGEHFDDDRPIESALGGDEDSGHACATEFPVDQEIGGQRRLQAVLKITHGVRKLMENGKTGR
ncbi:hypothetical protein MASR1M101_13580 [Gemmatimonas sp.]